jgi:uncharacterized membrane protein
MTAATIICLAASALMAGLFFGYSTFTMGGLRSIAPRDGLVAMQGINQEAPRSVPFMAVFLGGALLAVVLGIVAATRLDQREAPYQLVGAVLNAAGVLVTMGFHVPRNNALDQVEPGGDGADRAWTDHARTWTRGNHVRTISYLASTVLFAIALAEG